MNYIYNISLKNFFFIVSGLILLVLAFSSFNSGISGDEYFEEDQAELIYNYYNTFGKDKTALNPEYNLEKYYGQSFSTIAYTLNKWFNIENIYESRHLLNSISGWMLILMTGLTASLLFGWRAGLLALLFMTFSPKILGHTWNNPKDIPFATTYVFTLYFLLAFVKKLPKVEKKSLVFIAIGIAASISIRIGGLVMIPYLFLFTGMYYLTSRYFYSKNGFQNALKAVGYLVIVSIAAYFLGILLWPYGLSDPIHNPIEALKEMTNYDVGLNQLYEGKMTMSKELPWYYGLKYIIITSPLVVFLGLLVFFPALLLKKHTRIEYLLHSFLLFAFAFPIAYTIYKNSNLYGGWRHLLWTYSPLVVLATGGFEFLLSKKNKYTKYVTLAVITILLIHPVIHTFKNHPFEYIYYNQLVGGVKGAYGNYEMDYYYHSLREGADWLIKNEVGEDTITVATNHSRITQYYFRNYPQVIVVYSRYYEKSKDDWDYAVWANTHITPIQLEKGYWPPKETIHTMDVDGVPIGAVVKRISNEDYNGYQALLKGNQDEAEEHFRNFLKVYPENEEAWQGLAQVKMNKRQYDSTIVYADKSLEYNPRQIVAALLKASAQNSTKQYKNALKTSNEILEIKDDFGDAHFQKAYALKYLGQANDALKEFQLAIAYNKGLTASNYQSAEILSNYKNYKKAIEIYAKILEERPNDFVATIFSARNYYLIGDVPKAKQILTGIPQNLQNRLETVALKCRIAIDEKDLQSASNYLRMAQNIQNYGDLFVLRARYIMASQNNKQAAVNELKKGKEVDPVNREIQDLLASLERETTHTANQSQQSRQPAGQQSIMYQKAKKKTTSPIQIPGN